MESCLDSCLIASRVKRTSAGDTDVTQRIVQYNAVVQAALAINRLGPCAAARARINRFLNARCSTYTTTPHFLSLKTQNCDPTCTSPATGRSGTHSGPGNTTRQILTIHTVTHMANVAPVPTLSISMLKHGADARRWSPMRLCCS